MTTSISRACAITTNTAPAKRNTRQRGIIAAALRNVSGFVSAQNLHERLGGDAPSLATVYRTLQVLVEEGIADTVNRGGEQVYRACGGEHHHHLVCMTCGSTTEIHGDDVERWAVETASRHGFRLVSHVADIYGECGNCAG